MARFNYQYAKSDTLASQMAAGATSGTLSSGNFANFTGDYLVLDYDTSSKEIIKCNVTGTAISSATRGVDGTSDVTHAAGAKVGYMWLPVHADHVSVAAEEGWIESQDTWVYASASTFTISGVDRTATYVKGTKLRFKQGGGYKYATVASSSFSTNTTVTIIVNTDYVIANAAITDAYFSYADIPQGFPTWFSYTPTTNITLGSGTLTGRYTVRGGNSILANIYFKFNGSTMASGSLFGLPISTTATVTSWPGSAYILDSGTAEYTWIAVVSASSSSVSVVGNGTAGGITTTQPMTWANNDVLAASVEYQF